MSYPAICRPDAKPLCADGLCLTVANQLRIEATVPPRWHSDGGSRTVHIIIHSYLISQFQSSFSRLSTIPASFDFLPTNRRPLFFSHDCLSPRDQRYGMKLINDNLSVRCTRYPRSEVPGHVISNYIIRNMHPGRGHVQSEEAKR